jgi:hypothetical protein
LTRRHCGCLSCRLVSSTGRSMGWQ